MNKKFYLTIFSLFIVIISIYIAYSSYSLFLKNKILEIIPAEQIPKQKDAVQKTEEKDYLLGNFSLSLNKNFILVPSLYTTNANKIYLRKETLEAFIKMQNAAKKDGIDLDIVSATRNFLYQKNIWNNKWEGLTLVDGADISKTIPNGLERFKKILEYSAAPGTSRHHWGTDIDINNINNDYFEKGLGLIAYNWLTKNAQSFGFCQPYEANSTGYKEEKWHWSYVPLSSKFIQEYKKIITDSDIKNFDGDDFVPSLDLINEYVLNVNPECL